MLQVRTLYAIITMVVVAVFNVVAVHYVFKVGMRLNDVTYRNIPFKCSYH